jgi:hypothetical protein
VKLSISKERFLPLNKEFNYAASKLQLSILNLVNLLTKINEACKNYEKTQEGFFNKVWNICQHHVLNRNSNKDTPSKSWGSFVDPNPINDVELLAELYEKIKDFDQNLRSLEEAYIENLKYVSCMSV